MDLPPTRCPMLGHEVPLSYCYRVASGHPCRRLFECWERLLPALRRVVARSMTSEEWRACFETSPPSKMDTLLGLIEQAKDRLQERSGESLRSGPYGRRTKGGAPAVDTPGDDGD